MESACVHNGKLFIFYYPQHKNKAFIYENVFYKIKKN